MTKLVWLIVLGGSLAANLHAAVIMTYMGQPYTKTEGSLATAHHVEGIAEFAAVGDGTALSVTLRVVSTTGENLLEGTAYNVPSFQWNGDSIIYWDYGIYIPDRPIGRDYFTSARRPPGGPHDGVDFTADDAYQANPPWGDTTYSGLAYDVTATGTWTSVPEPSPLLAALGLVAVGALIQIRRGLKRESKD